MGTPGAHLSSICTGVNVGPPGAALARCRVRGNADPDLGSLRLPT